ncbi:MAG: PilZ domain-containing protein [Oligoflexia bacterium]|nr:PilZ domain-containing protein [Oligoflexia bacterium]
MRFRPWPIVILAVLHWLAPLGNFLFSAWLEGVTLAVYWAQFRESTDLLGYVDFFLLLPIGGLAIYSCKKWSYPIFLLVTLETVSVNVMTWRQSPELFPLPLLLALSLLDALFVGYFLLPAVRAAYMDPRLRWWEAQPRYQIRLPVRIKYPGRKGADRGAIANISVGGLMIGTSAKLDERADFHFTVLGRHYAVEGKRVYQRGDGPYFCGIEFIHTEKTRRELTRLIRALRILRFSTRDREEQLRDLWRWALTLVTTGKGWVPELSPGVAPAKPRPRRRTLKAVRSLPSPRESVEENRAKAA